MFPTSEQEIDGAALTLERHLYTWYRIVIVVVEVTSSIVVVVCG